MTCTRRPNRLRAFVARSLAVALLAVCLTGPSVASVGAQEQPSQNAPAPNIVPRPNSGEEPRDAGDRGGALQLLVLALVVVGVGGAVLHLRGQARRARPPEVGS